MHLDRPRRTRSSPWQQVWNDAGRTNPQRAACGGQEASQGHREDGFRPQPLTLEEELAQDVVVVAATDDLMILKRAVPSIFER